MAESPTEAETAPAAETPSVGENLENGEKTASAEGAGVDGSETTGGVDDEQKEQKEENSEEKGTEKGAEDGQLYSNEDLIKHRLAFTPEELAGLTGLFEVIDEDKSGTLDTGEITKMLVIAECKVTEDQVKGLLGGKEKEVTLQQFISICAENKPKCDGSDADSRASAVIVESIFKAAKSFSNNTFNADMVLDEKELNQLRLVLRKASYVPGGFKPEIVFKRWDKDNDGELDFDEMHDLIFSLGPDLSEEEYDQFFNYLDYDGDESIGIAEFVAFVKQNIGRITKKKSRNVALAASGETYTKGMRGSDVDDSKLKRFDGLAKDSNKGWTKDGVLTDTDIFFIRKKIRAAAYYQGGKNLPRLFKEWDKDHNGVLDRQELATQMKKLLPTSNMTEEELTQVIDALDIDGDGRIVSEEFAKFFNENPPKPQRLNGQPTIVTKANLQENLSARSAFSPQELVQLQTAFQTIDTNGSGAIDKNEIIGVFAAFNKNGEASEADQVQIVEMLRVMDVNKDSEIDFGEFTIMCAKAKRKQKCSDLFTKLSNAAALASQAMSKDEILDADELNQIKIRWRMLSYSTKGMDPEHLFNIFDKDKDGKLSYNDLHAAMKIPSQLSEEEFSQFFDYLDSNKDDYIGKEEFVHFVSEKPPRGVRKRLDKELTIAGQANMYANGMRTEEKVVEEHSWTADGVLDDEEIEMIKRKLRAVSYANGGQDIPKLFNSWDTNKDGQLDMEEISFFLRRILPKAGISPEELRQFVEYLDKDSDGLVSLDEFDVFLKPRGDNGNYISAAKMRKRKERLRRAKIQKMKMEEQINTVRARIKNPPKPKTVDYSYRNHPYYALVAKIRENFNVMEIVQLKRAFKKIDKDKSNLVDAKELVLLFKQFGATVSLKDVNLMMDGARKNSAQIAEAMKNDPHQSALPVPSEDEITFREFLFLCVDNKTGRHEKLFQKTPLYFF